MKKTVLTGAVLLLPLLASAALPTGEPFAQFKTMKGSRKVDTERYVTVYVKSDKPSGEVYFQIGNTDKVDTLKITKANTLTKYEKKNLTADQVDVRIWGNSDIWFLNVNGNDAYDLSLGQTAKDNIREFRCENDSLTDLSCVNDMKKLEYLVIGGNKRLKKLNVKSATLQRFQLGRQLGLEEITVEGPELWEFKLEYSKIKSLDFSKCPKIKNIVATYNRELADVNFGAGQALYDVQVGGSDKLKSIVMKNKPALYKYAVHECPSLTSVEIADLPKLQIFTVRACGLTSYDISGFPALRTLSLGENPFTSLNIDLPDLTSVTIDKCPLEVIDLTKLPVLKSVYIRDGQVKKVNFNQNALDNTMTILYLTNNAITLADLPARPKNVRATHNYYAPQRQPELPKSIKSGEVLDLSAWSKGREASGYTPSEIKWETIFEETLTAGKDYTVEDGKFKFLHEVEDSVRCFITHPAFPSFGKVKDAKNQDVDWRIISNYMVVKNGGGSVDDIQSDGSDIRIYGSGNAIMIETPEDLLVRVYSLSGNKVYEGFDRQIELPSGIYLVQAGGERRKILLKSDVN